MKFCIMILNNKPKAEKQPANYALNLKKKVRSATLVGVLLVFLAIIGFINAAIHKMEILIVPSVIALICGLLLIALSAAVMKRTWMLTILHLFSKNKKNKQVVEDADKKQPEIQQVEIIDDKNK